MGSCPIGHESSTDDYCEVCGARVEPVVSEAADAQSKPSHRTEPVSPSPSEPLPPCPVCSTPRPPDAVFCECCRFCFDAAVPGWVVEVHPDSEYFDRMTPEGLQFPTAMESRTFVLDSATVGVGRRREADGRGSESDLVCAIDDPGVSRLHAVFLRGTDGSYSVVDAGSTNGTRINGASLPIPVDTPVPLADGDRIHIGAWTTITIHLC